MSESGEARIATSDEEIAACFPVMRELRTHLQGDGFVERVREQQVQGYTLAYLEAGGRCVAVAGFRIIENLAYGRHLYVDDLVTAAAARSEGHGSRLIAWLEAYARGHGCGRLHLDSGTQRTSAHRFYFRERLDIVAFHFAKTLD